MPIEEKLCCVIGDTQRNWTLPWFTFWSPPFLSFGLSHCGRIPRRTSTLHRNEWLKQGL
jgi:hypothetical protein